MTFGVESKTMMANHGSVGEFFPSKETWLSYFKKLEQYFLANNLQHQREHFQELVQLVQEHNYQVERFSVHTLTQRSIANVAAHLRELSEHCMFGDTLNDMLKDCLICGCNDDRLLHLLLSKHSHWLRVIIMNWLNVMLKTYKSLFHLRCMHRKDDENLFHNIIIMVSPTAIAVDGLISNWLPIQRHCLLFL